MKIALQYVNDSLGKLQSVQVPVTDWEKLMTKMKHYEQALKIKKDLQLAFKEVEQIRKSKVNINQPKIKN
jgi:asparagine synthetase A